MSQTTITITTQYHKTTNDNTIARSNLTIEKQYHNWIRYQDTTAMITTQYHNITVMWKTWYHNTTNDNNTISWYNCNWNHNTTLMTQ